MYLFHIGWLWVGLDQAIFNCDALPRLQSKIGAAKSQDPKCQEISSYADCRDARPCVSTGPCVTRWCVNRGVRLYRGVHFYSVERVKSKSWKSKLKSVDGDIAFILNPEAFPELSRSNMT